MANKPAHKIHIGYVSAVIWANEKPSGEGIWYTVDVSRSYKDKSGALKNTSTLKHDDCLVAAFLLQRANAWIMDQ